LSKNVTENDQLAIQFDVVGLI